MSPYLTSAVAIAVLFPLAVGLRLWLTFRALAESGSGGLGAVSGPLSSLIVYYLALVAVTWTAIYVIRRARR
jgi:hypothetical protein